MKMVRAVDDKADEAQAELQAMQGLKAKMQDSLFVG